jgi:hypothetical protein
VVICDINPKTLPEARAEIEATGARCLGAVWLKETTVSAMELHAIAQDIDAELDRLQRLRALLTDHTAPLKGEPTRKGSTMSTEGRARIAAAQRKRWARAQRK